MTYRLYWNTVSSTTIGHCKRVKVRGTEWPINNGEEPNGQSIMDKSVIQPTLGTRHRIKTNKMKKKQHRKLKQWVTGLHQISVGEPMCSRKVRSSCFV